MVIAMFLTDSEIVVRFGDSAFHIPLLVVVIFAVTFVVALLVLSRLAQFLPLRGGGSCRWRRLAGDDSSPFVKWQCKVCAVEAFSTDNRPPKECKKSLKPVV